MIKIDMAKAYDRLEWDFLFNVLNRFGFNDQFIRLIRKMVHNNWFSILINGTPAGFFKSSRGVRQGDPIAPSLFIIAEEVLSRSLTKAFQCGLIEWYASPRHCPNISHLLFADDTIIFCNGNLISIRNLLKILQDYERASGQSINTGKSGFFIHSRNNNSTARKIQDVTGFVKHSFPHKYLGFPLIKGRCKKIHYTGILHNIQRRISGWKCGMLS